MLGSMTESGPVATMCGECGGESGCRDGPRAGCNASIARRASSGRIWLFWAERPVRSMDATPGVHPRTCGMCRAATEWTQRAQMHLARMGQRSRKCRRERWSSKTSSTEDSMSEFAGSSLQVARRLLDDADCSHRCAPYILTRFYWIAAIGELIAIGMEVKCQSTSLEDVQTRNSSFRQVFAPQSTRVHRGVCCQDTCRSQTHPGVQPANEVEDLTDNGGQEQVSNKRCRPLFGQPGVQISRTRQRWELVAEYPDQHTVGVIQNLISYTILPCLVPAH